MQWRKEMGRDGEEAAPAPRRGKNGLGMLSGRERLVRVGGASAVESAQGKGTKATMIVPVSTGNDPTEDMMPYARLRA